MVCLKQGTDVVEDRREGRRRETGDVLRPESPQQVALRSSFGIGIYAECSKEVKKNMTV